MAVHIRLMSAKLDGFRVQPCIGRTSPTDVRVKKDQAVVLQHVQSLCFQGDQLPSEQSSSNLLPSPYLENMYARLS